MLYLTTGANGAGKTLLTLRDVREKSVKENRPVCYNGRFELVSDFGWKKIDIKDWQLEPDGCIFLVDECHNDFPSRKPSEAVPEHVKMLAEHRRRGFDFYLITQHPLNIDAFIRRLIGSPGWHRHLKRASGAPLVSVLSWPAVNVVCEKSGSGASGSTSMTPFPREVYNWYTSTSLDTAKTKIPFQVKLLVVALLAFPVMGYYGYKTLMHRYDPTAAKLATSAAASGPAAGPPGADKHILTPKEYAASFTPRVEGLAYTAPRYDDNTKPVTAPFPAACVSMGDRCECYTQQATKLQVAKPLCLQIVKNGFFKDWDQPAPMGMAAARPVVPAYDGAPPVHPVTAVLPVAAAMTALPSLPLPSSGNNGGSRLQGANSGPPRRG